MNRIAFLFGLFTGTLCGQAFPEFGQPDTVACGGVERWAVKVLSDSAAATINFTPLPFTVNDFVQIATPTPSSSMKRVSGIEDKTYKIIARITIKKDESDEDIHLVFSDGTNTFIGEIPDPNCPDAGSTMHAMEYQKAKEFVDKYIGPGNVYNVNIPSVEVTGIAFIDPPHGQTGAAPNHLELHPILHLKFSGISNTSHAQNNKEVHFSPNPFLESTYLSIESSRELPPELRFELRTIYGQIQYIYPIVRDDMHHLGLEIFRRDLDAGMYLFEITSDGKVMYTGKLFVL